MKQIVFTVIAMLLSTPIARAEVSLFATDCDELAKGTNCKSWSTCKVSTEKDAKAFACWRRLDGVSCLDALATKPPAGTALADKDKEIIKAFYKMENANAVCARVAQIPWGFLAGAVKTSAWNTTGGQGIWGGEHAVQIMPSVAIGIPFGVDDTKPSGRALKSVEVVGGAAIRYTPNSYLVGGHLFIGTAAATTENIDATVFPNPVLVAWGVGVDFGAGALSFSVVNARLHRDGIRSSSGDDQWFLQVAFDLTAIGIGVFSGGDPS